MTPSPDSVVHGRLCLERRRGLEDGVPDDDAETGLIPKDAEEICCRSCGASITTDAHLFSPDPSGPEYVFENPAGVICEITCFGACWGLRFLGGAEQAHTWFLGFSWRIASCEACSIHLGWRFEADGAQDPPWFFGLLTGKLARRGAASP